MADPRREPAQTAPWLARNAIDCLPHGGLQRRLEQAAEEGRPLRVKLGIDPTAPDIHLGHTVVLGKLREFQDLGHVVVLIVGDYTARVGDPSGRSSTRPLLSAEEIDHNAQTFAAQAARVLGTDPEQLEVRRNSEWLDMAMDALLRLASTTTIAQLLERDDFSKRLGRHEPISVLELLYPLLQGYDSVAVGADVELGGTDQKFNLLLARDIQRAYGVPEQVILTMPILVGTDGVEKMSKSLNNHIGVTEAPGEIYGKTLSTPDHALASYWDLLLGEPVPQGTGPRDAKRELARRLVARFWDEQEALRAEESFDRVFVSGEAPTDATEAVFTAGDEAVHLPGLLADVFGISRSEARRLLEQGGVRLGERVLGPDCQDLPAAELDGQLLRVGKRRYVRLRQGASRSGESR